MVAAPWRLTANDHVNYEESESSMTRQSGNDVATRYKACGANLSGGLSIIARNESWYMQSENRYECYECHTMSALPSLLVFDEANLGGIQMCLKSSFLPQVCM